MWVVDEAGMVDTRDMAKLVQLAQAEGTKLVGVGDELQLPAVGIGGGFTPACELTDGRTLLDVRRQTTERELAALRAYRAGRQQALAGYAAAGQIIVTDTREQALAAAAWHEHAKALGDPLARVTDVALMAGRPEDPRC